MRTKLIWVIVADQPHNPSPQEWDDFVEADMKINGWSIRPTKKSALRLAQSLANECSYPMEVSWAQGKRAWKYGISVEPQTKENK